MDKKYSTNLNETYDLFKSQGVSIIGKGYEEIMSSPALFEAYTTSITEGVSADSRAEMAQLMANTNAHLLTEGSVAGIAPICSLSGPVIRKLWPSIGLKNAVKTKVATTPSFMINYTKPYFITAENGKEVKHYVVRDSLIGQDGTVASDLAGNYKELSFDANGVADFSDFCKVDTASRIKYQPLDNDFTLVSVVVNDGTNDVTVKINKKVGVEHVIIYDGVVAEKKFTLLVRLAAEDCKAYLQVIAETGLTVDKTKVVVRGHRSVEYNEVATSWGFDIAREDILIGTGDHMQSPLTVESLTDMKALYQIDGTKEAVNLMTNAMALRTDGMIFNFLKNEFINQPGAGEFASYPAASEYIAVFDVKPAAGFAGGPKAWREELKPVFDHLAARIKNQTFLGAGCFNIVANPLDAQLITNVDWSFRGGQGSVDGVNVNYSLGTYYGSAYTYKLISTEIVKQGVMYLVFIPEEDTQLTYNYWCYSFSTELGYRDPNRAMAPSIMLCKRDVLKSFLPAIGAVKIVGNDAGANYDPFRDVIPTTTGTEGASGSATI